MSLLSYRGAGTLIPGAAGGGPGGPTIPTVWSQTLANAWYINTHLTYGVNKAGQQNAYRLGASGRTADEQIAYAVTLIGAAGIRETIAVDPNTRAVGSTLQRNRVKALYAATGAGVIFASGDMHAPTTPPLGADVATEVLTNFVVAGQNIVDFVTGTNEPNHSGATSQASKTITLQTQLWASALHGVITIGGPPLADATATVTATYGDMSNLANIGDVHCYPGGNKPSAQLDQHLTNAAIMYPTNPNRMFSEGGYTNALNGYQSGSGHGPAPEDVVGVYYPRELLEIFNRGAAPFAGYELVDQYPDAGLTLVERHFGIFRNDWTPKAAAIAMGRFMNLLADPGPTYTPTDVHAKVTGGTSDLRFRAFQKSDGTYLLCLWRDVSIWTPSTTGPGAVATPSPPTSAITVTLGASSTVLHYDVSANTSTLNTTPTPVSTSSGTTHTVTLGANLIVLAFT